MKAKILSILRSSNEYVSGQALCNELGVSRTAVWKVINQLKEEGYEVDSVQNKGYKITSFPDIITASEIESLLMQNADSGIVNKVIYYAETDSTNNEAKRKSEEPDIVHGTLFVTECQTLGRGRRGRNWISPPGSGIWMTLLLRPDINPAAASMLTIVSAMALVDALRYVVPDTGFYIKWPNDVVLNGKKISGILTEMSAEPDYINYIIVGTGINVNTEEFDESIRDTASSILLETGKHIKRSEVINQYSLCFKKYYDTFIKEGNLAGLKDTYNQMLINKGRMVKALYDNQEIVGKALGINDEGELMVEALDGVVVVRSGEVSVRGLYGYV